MHGAALANKDILTNSNNEAYKYAVARNVLYQKKQYVVELFASYETQLNSIAEWWKQLFGESEGKDGKGLFPASVNFSTDLHSLGQFIQDGNKILFETVLQIKHPITDLSIPKSRENLDELNYLTKYSLNQINSLALQGTVDAHTNEGQVPNIVLVLDTMDAKMFGYLVTFFFYACAMSAYLIDVNPFNQPGVEVYKKKMFALLGK